MSETNFNKHKAQLSRLSGAAKQQRLTAIHRENEVLYAIGRFGWLTSHQIANILWPQKINGNDLARRMLSRLHKQSFLNSEVMARSPGQQIKAFYLKPKAIERLQESPVYKDALKIQTTKRTITESRYQYHRLISNQALIDVRKGRLVLPFCDVDSKMILLSEHEMRPHRKDINSHFGCIPDGLLKSNSTMLVLEVENSTRGPARHGSKLRQEGNKLEGWLPIYIDRLRTEGCYGSHLLTLGSNGEYSDAKEIFVCTSEKVFRSIWRKMYKLLGQFNKQSNFIYYIVMKKKLWVDPLRSENIYILEHNAAFTRQLVAVGEEQTRKYSAKKLN